LILQEKTINVEKSSNFESTDFRIDSKYKNKVLWLLINQYRYKVRTPVQEIISNARDAQRENGNPDTPIKIQLPTRLLPTFKVRDYGVGMSEERIKTIFTSFGASTKNADNVQTGGFGIGAKSPLAYTDQFNIKTYIDGQYWLYVIAKNTDNGISIHLLETGSTDEANGTEVQIPVKENDTNRFKKAACRCTMFWDVQPAFNLSEDELYKTGKCSKISDNFEIYSDNELGNIFDSSVIVVVDGIPYELDTNTKRKVDSINNIDNKLNWGAKAILKINTGDIELLQTRESIEESDYTLSQLQKTGFKAFNELELYLASCLNAKTLDGRYKQFMDIREKFRNVNAHDFETFRFSGNGQIGVDKNLLGYGYDFYGKTGRKTEKAQKKAYVNKYYNDAIYFKKSYLDNVFYDDIKANESDNLKARRLRHYLDTQDAQNVVVLKQHDATNFVYMRTLRLLGARKLSSLPLPEKKKRKGSKGYKKPKTDKITVHKFYNSSSTTYKQEIKLDNNHEKFIYVNYSTGGEITCQKWRNLLRDMGYSVCKIAASTEKEIKDDKNFISEKDFLDSFKITDELFAQYVNRSFYGHYWDNSLKTYKKLIESIVDDSKRIADKVLVKYANIVGVPRKSKDATLPERVKKMIETQFKSELKKISAACVRITKRIDEMYPGCYAVGRYSSKDLLKRSELLYYINTTYRRFN
jgi:hypothetical protein